MDAKNAALISNPLTTAALASNLQQLRENLVNGGLTGQANSSALMNAFGLNANLPLPLGLWDNSLLNAAMYMDTNNSLFNLKQNIDQLNGNGLNGFNLSKKREDTTQIKREVSMEPKLCSVSNLPTATKRSRTAITNETLFNNGSTSNGNSMSAASLSKELAYLEQGKSFPCPECHKTFATEVDLKAHLLRHVMLHPYSCPTCGKGFKYDHTLDFHVKSVHGGVDTPPPKLNAKNHNKKQNGMNHQNGRKESVEERATSKLNRLSMAKAAAQLHSANLDHLELEDLNNNNIPANHMANSSSPAQQINHGIPNPDLVQVKEEKVLIVMLEGINPLNDQSYTLYKCNLCGFAFPTLGPVTEHVQAQHTNQSQLTCEKCGANFKWQNELILHEQLHKAMEQVQQQPATNSASFKNMLMTPLLQPNLMLMNQYLTSQQAQLDKNNNHHNGIGSNSNGSLPLPLTNGSNGSTSSLSSELPSPPVAQLQPRQSLTSPNTLADASVELQGLNLCKSQRKDSESSSQESLSLRKPSKLMLKELRSEEIDELSKNIAVVKENVTSDLGEIEETAPGQFKCRFCEKTFDRVFSVHRHERVHTGFKPCVCKVCGRGFSEKRNLRHHIIRFHSDGSGRELLRRVRKDKNSSLESGEARKQLKAMEMNVDGHFLSNHASDDEPLGNGDENGMIGEEQASSVMFDQHASPQSSNVTVADEQTDEELMDVVCNANDENNSSQLNRAQSNGISSSTSCASSTTSSSSSSRRRKSVPCKKVNEDELPKNGEAAEETEPEEEEEELEEEEEEEEELKNDVLSYKSETSSDVQKADFDDQNFISGNHSGEPCESALPKKQFFTNGIKV